jgi:uncharacterized protein (TIGR02266 family)
VGGDVVTSTTRAPHLRRFRRRTVRVRVDIRTAGAVRTEWATTLGAGGMFLETEDALPVGTRLKLHFRLPGGIADHELEGRVAWEMTAHRADGSPAPSPGMGIEFTDAAATADLARELERELEPELRD